MNFLIGYVIFMNVISYLFMWISIRTNFLKLEDKARDIICLLLAVVGGFIGIMLAKEMFNYGEDNKIFKRWIPLIIFVEVCIIVYVVCKKNDIQFDINNMR